jgi:hypothetical protein
MADLTINGQHFLVSVLDPADRVDVFLSDAAGVPTGDSFSVYDPAGPNAGSNLPGTSVSVWSDTTITFDYDTAEVGDGSGTEFIHEVRMFDATGLLIEFYDVRPAIPQDAGPSLTYPLLEGICSPAANTIRFTGQRFLTATVGPVGYVIPRLASYASGGTLDGPGMIYELADGSPDANGWTLVTHTDNVIEISNPAFGTEDPDDLGADFVVQGVAFHDPTAGPMYYYEPWGDPSPYSAPVDGAGCPALITIDDVVGAGPNTIGISGTDLDQTTRFRVFDNLAFDEYYYDSSGPNAGLNPPGATVTVYGPTSVIIGDTAMSGLTITQVQARSGTLPGDGVADEWYGSVLVA